MPVALAPEAAALLSAIESEDRVPYAIEGAARRRPLIANDLRAVLADASERQDRLREGSVIDRSVMSGKAARHVEEAWGRSEREPDHASRVSACVRLALLAAGCTIDELMEFMGHAHLQMVDR